MDVVLIDSPVANVANIARALRAVGAELRVTRDRDSIAAARKIVLPGVGSFIAAMRWIEETGVGGALREAIAGGASLLGICVGHQLLFEVSHEMGLTAGLGLVRGEVHKIEGSLPVPQIGWNRVIWSAGVPPAGRGSSRAAVSGASAETPPGETPGGWRAGRPRSTESGSPLFRGLESGTPFYFVNSYAAREAPSEVARADYGGPFTAAVQSGRVLGVQFHPEKSSTAGLQILRNFVAWT